MMWWGRVPLPSMNLHMIVLHTKYRSALPRGTAELSKSADTQVDSAVIGTTPLVPVNATLSSPLAHIVETSSNGVHTVPARPNVLIRRAVSLAAMGRSVFSYTFLAPSTPGAHTIVAVATIATSGGGVTPIAAPVVSCSLDLRFVVFAKSCGAFELWSSLMRKYQPCTRARPSAIGKTIIFKQFLALAK